MCSKLYLAVCEGRVKGVIDMLQKGRHGGSAAAVATDQAEGIEHAQCDIHEVSPDGNNLLHLAADQGHDKLIGKLYSTFRLEYRSLLSSRNSTEEETPLHCAARAGRVKTVGLLLRHARQYGDNVIRASETNSSGDTALHLVARQGHRAAVNAVVDAAPGVAYEANSAGMSPLYLAVMSGSEPAAKAIMTRCSHASAVGPGSQNALHAAVFQGSEMVQLLMRWRPSLADQVDDDNNSSPLHFASSDGDPYVVRAILRLAAPSTVYRKDSEGHSALHVAARMGHAIVVEMLMTKHLDAAELRDHHGRTFLHSAAMRGHSKVVLLAIKSWKLGRLLNAQDKDGNTPLHLAVEAGAFAVVDCLMSRGKVRPDVINNQGFTPYDLAVKSTSAFKATSLVATFIALGAQSRPQRQDHLEPWSGGDIGQEIEKMSDGLAVVAVLIATVAFGAAFNVPGSYKDNGRAVLEREFTFQCFVVLDGVALMNSVFAVILLVYGKVSPRSTGSWKIRLAALSCIWFSLISMILAFYAALAAVTCIGVVNSITYVVIYDLFFALTQLVMFWITPEASLATNCKFFWKGIDPVTKRRIRRQSPFVSAFVYNLLIFTLINTFAVGGLIYLQATATGCSGVPSPMPALAPTPL